MGTEDNTSLGERIDQLIRSGRGTEALEILKDLDLSEVPRSEAHKMARHARRLYRPDISMRLLNRYVRPDKPLMEAATIEERAEYAAALQQIGVNNESLSLLEEIDKTQYPASYLYQAFCYFSRWEYERAIPLLEEYLKQPINEYESYLGRVNLAAALLGSSSSSREKVEKLIAELADSEYRLLYGNALEIGAQMAVSARDFVRAEEYLLRASEVLSASSERVKLFVQKWELFIGIYKAPEKDRELSLKRLEDIEAHAQEQGHWETLREVELLRAIINGDEERYLKLHFATPYPSYRSRLKGVYSRFHTPPKLPQSFVWKRSEASDKVMEVVEARIKDPYAGELKKNSLSHRLMMILSADLYRPMKIGQLFSELYPDEYYNPLSSPNKVHQAVRRLREDLVRLEFPAEICESNGMYYLSLGPQCALELLAPEERTYSDPQLITLSQSFGSESFSASQAAEILGKNQRAVQRAMKEWLDQGSLEKLGTGRSTKYKLVG